MSYCHKCGNQASDTDQFCRKCGTELAAGLPGAQETGKKAQPIEKGPAPLLVGFGKFILSALLTFGIGLSLVGVLALFTGYYPFIVSAFLVMLALIIIIVTAIILDRPMVHRAKPAFSLTFNLIWITCVMGILLGIEPLVAIGRDTVYMVRQTYLIINNTTDAPAATSAYPKLTPDTPGIKPAPSGMKAAYLAQVVDQQFKNRMNNYLISNPGVSIFYDRQPPYRGEQSAAVNLVNNDRSVDVSFSELKIFLQDDNTDLLPYGPMVCADFAEMIHNKAENAGIRTAWVAIDFSDLQPGHACNAFWTTDKGLVFVDCTGRREVPKEFNQSTQQLVDALDISYDAIAYIVQTKPYGLVHLKKIWGTEYRDYERWKVTLAVFDSRLANLRNEIARYVNASDIYDARVKEHNSRVSTRGYDTDRKIYNELVDMQWKLEQLWTWIRKEANELKVIQETLGPVWGTMGTVSKTEIYW